MGLFIEEKMLDAVRKLLSGRVNELLGEIEFPIPLVEFGRSLTRGNTVTPVLRLFTCERTEKERIVRVEAYTLTIGFTIPEWPEGERNCYAYASLVATALGENPTLGGVVDWAELTGKKYVLPKTPCCGEGWEVVLTLRVTVEMKNE